jgi:hypothetical protein
MAGVRMATRTGVENGEILSSKRPSMPWGMGEDNVRVRKAYLGRKEKEDLRPL